MLTLTLTASTILLLVMLVKVYQILRPHDFRYNDYRKTRVKAHLDGHQSLQTNFTIIFNENREDRSTFSKMCLKFKFTTALALS